MTLFFMLFVVFWSFNPKPVVVNFFEIDILLISRHKGEKIHILQLTLEPISINYTESSIFTIKTFLSVLHTFFIRIIDI